jgi:Flp pilus assembly protein TadG
MRSFTSRSSSGDAGVFAVLYAIFVLVLFGVAAMVVDLSSMRESRRVTRSAGDSAALAAASQLNVLDPTASSPRAACEKAWRYLADQLSGLNYADRTSSCNPLPLTGTVCPASPSPAPVAVSSGKYRVRITWPVPSTSNLLTTPDVEPVSSPTQDANSAFDGTNDDRCARIGVEVFRDNKFGFANALGIRNGTTRAASVARAVVEGNRQDVIAALNILETDKCDAVVTQGQGSITVNGPTGQAGVIAIESSGRDNNANRCPNNRPYVLDPLSNNNNFVHANGPGGVGTGVIYSYAMIGPTLGNPADAFDTNLAPPSSTIINPRPARLFERYGATPVTDIFDCQFAVDGCTNAAGSWITELETAYAGTSAPITGYAGAQPGFTGGTFQTLPDAALVPNFSCNTQPSDPTVIVPPGNWYINCATLSVANTMIFQGGVIVTRGGVEAGSSSSCIALNVPATSCPTINTAVTPTTTTPAPTGDAILYIRSGRLYKTSQAQLYMPQTFTYLTDAGNGSFIDLAGGSGTLMWTNPRGTDCATTYVVPADQQRCRDRRFVRLTLWSESTADHSMGGQTGLQLRGVLFTPRAQFTYDGQGTQNQTDAQFWTKLLVVKGQAGLTMVADPESSVARPSLGVLLIR